jgi:calcineurin-like phosphoesterase
MQTLIFNTNITSPIGIQAIWEALKTLGINNFNIDFQQMNLKIITEHLSITDDIIKAICSLGYNCKLSYFTK